MQVSEIWNNIQTVLLIASFIFYVIKFRGGEQQNLLGKTISDLVNTIQSLQKSLVDAEERSKGIILRYQREYEDAVRDLEVAKKQRDDAQDEAGRIEARDHQAISNRLSIERECKKKDELIKTLQQEIETLKAWRRRVDSWFIDRHIDPETLEPMTT